jgi:hypothetical protein
MLNGETGDIWLQRTIAAAVIAACGYVANIAVESIQKWQRFKAKQKTSLFKLLAVLRTMRAAYQIQATHRNELARRIRSKNDGSRDVIGYEELFSQYFEKFSKGDQELHGYIRGITIHAIEPLNRAVAKWLDGDTYHRARRATPLQKELAVALDQLSVHLSLWRARYAIWIPEQPSHALVYLADEKKYGIGFPRGIEKIIEANLHIERRGDDQPKNEDDLP